VDRFAVFVDAGYLFKQGAQAVEEKDEDFGRDRVSLKGQPPTILKHLIELGQQKALERTLLRIYWYDGATREGPSRTHEQLAHLDDVKVRLGAMSEFENRQKEVDSLIVMDLLELARLGAICDALLLVSDRDIRPAVQLAQSYGLRVHLLGILGAKPESSNPTKQGRHLRAECDTTTVWDRKILLDLLSVDPVAPLAASFGKTLEEIRDRLVQERVGTLSEDALHNILDVWTQTDRLPSEDDNPLVKEFAKRLGTLNRIPRHTEKIEMRNAFAAAASARLTALKEKGG